jgi:hypothetical protein
MIRFWFDMLPLGRRSHRLRLLGVCAFAALAACSPDRLVTSDPPSTVVLSSAITTEDGAMGLYGGAINLFASAFGGSGNNVTDSYIVSTGEFTDELSYYYFGPSYLDDRGNSVAFGRGNESAQDGVFKRMQAARVTAIQARQALQQFGPPDSDPLVGRMYAYQGYAIVLLAEYFCNGVPLSVTPLNGPPRYAAASSTADMLNRAVALFDTAMTFSADSASYLNLARVGKGRALLDLGKFAEAAAAVASVPQDFVYNVQFESNTDFTIGGQTYALDNRLGAYVALSIGSPPMSMPLRHTHEGINGLDWTSDSVRVPATDKYTIPFPAKYANANAPIRLADGLEAQLIQAEAAFQANPSGTTWLTILNDLRATCTSASGCAPTPGITSTTLAPLTDSATARGRVLQIMAERAFWMYGTGHRQGDLRRLLRPPYDAAPYAFTQDRVYPTGAYTAPNSTYANPAIKFYGSDVVAIPPRTEQLYNPHYTGCFDLNP